MAFDTLDNETLSSRVSRELIRSIVSGRFVPHDLLPTEEQLCVEFGVSRSVVREAMKVVTGVGMARSRQGQGTVVLPTASWNNFSAELIKARRDTGTMHDVLTEVLELRSIIEVQAAGLAAVRGSEEDFDELAGLVQRMPATVDQPNTFIALDLQFHTEILRASANHLIVNLFGLLAPALTAAREIGLDGQRQPDGMNSAITEHEQVLAALRTGSARETEQAMRAHLTAAAGRVARGRRARR